MNRRLLTHRSHSWHISHMGLCRISVFMKKKKNYGVFIPAVYMLSIITNLRLFRFSGEPHPMGNRRTVGSCGHIHV
jgi:hypothetical protein